MSDENYESDFQTFTQMISYRTMQGYLVADRNDKALTATLYKPAEKINHTLHLVITLFTCGGWVIVWAILAINAPKEIRLRIYVDGQGNPVEESLRL